PGPTWGLRKPWDRKKNEESKYIRPDTRWLGAGGGGRRRPGKPRCGQDRGPAFCAELRALPQKPARTGQKRRPIRGRELPAGALHVEFEDGGRHRRLPEVGRAGGATR